MFPSSLQNLNSILLRTPFSAWKAFQTQGCQLGLHASWQPWLTVISPTILTVASICLLVTCQTTSNKYLWLHLSGILINSEKVVSILIKKLRSYFHRYYFSYFTYSLSEFPIHIFFVQLTQKIWTFPVFWKIFLSGWQKWSWQCNS